MKDQESFSGDELRAQFDKARANARQDLQNTGTDKILRDMSQTVSQLQQSGVDVRISVRSEGHSNAFDMMYSTSGSGGGTIEAHGFIETGKTCHLWTIASKHVGKPVARLYLSKHNVGAEGGRSTRDDGKTASRTTIPGHCYDFNEDADALRKFQQRLVTICANNAALLDSDPEGVFNTEPAPLIQKPSPKLKL